MSSGRGQRSGSSLDIAYKGILGSQTLPQFEGIPGRDVQSPTSAAMSPTDFLPKVPLEDRPLWDRGGQQGDSKRTFVKPSWMQVNPDYRTNWNITRDRYNLAPTSREAAPHLHPSVPHVTPPLQPSARDLFQVGARSFSTGLPTRMSPLWGAGEDQLRNSSISTRLMKPVSHTNDNRPSWSSIASDYKHDWDIARDRYDLLRFNSHLSLDNSRSLTAHSMTGRSLPLQSPTRSLASGLNQGIVVGASNLVSYPRPAVLTQIAPGQYLVTEPHSSY